MSTYTFRKSLIPYQALTDTQCGHVAYVLSDQRMAFARWGGVIDRTIAAGLRPWAQSVRLNFEAYRIANGDWVDLEIGQGLWGCLLDGKKPGQYVAFIVLDCGIPMKTKVDPRWVPRK